MTELRGKLRYAPSGESNRQQPTALLAAISPVESPSTRVHRFPLYNSRLYNSRTQHATLCAQELADSEAKGSNPLGNIFLAGHFLIFLEKPGRQFGEIPLEWFSE